MVKLMNVNDNKSYYERKKAIMPFIKDKGIEISEAELAKNYIEYDLYNSGNVITPMFDQYLQELFDDSKEPITPEVKLARVCVEKPWIQ